MCPIHLADSMKPTKINKITERVIITVIHSMLFFNGSSDAGEEGGRGADFCIGLRGDATKKV